MKTLKCTRKELEKKAAKLVAKKIKSLAKKKSKIVLAVPGGNSVPKVFDNLEKEKLPWEKVHIFMVDEREVPVSDKKSNFRIVDNHLISCIGCILNRKVILREQIHSYNYKKNLSSYNRKLKEDGNKFDIVLLSAGEDGHVASLFPNHPSIKNKSKSYIKVTNSPKPPKNRISASRSLLQKSRTAILLFFGESKQQAYKNFQDRKLTVEQCPAKLVKKIRDTYVFHAPC